MIMILELILHWDMNLDNGIRMAISKLEPSAVLFYGSRPDEIINSFPNVDFYVYEGNNSQKLKERKNG